MAKEIVYRGENKPRRFEVYITSLDGETPQDPDSCTVQFFKVGTYGYDSPSPKYTCSKVGTTGYWGADVALSNSMTLGDWLAEYEWVVGGVTNGAGFEFTVKEARRPYIHKDPNLIAPTVKVEE